MLKDGDEVKLKGKEFRCWFHDELAYRILNSQQLTKSQLEHLSLPLGTKGACDECAAFIAVYDEYAFLTGEKSQERPHPLVG